MKQSLQHIPSITLMLGAIFGWGNNLHADDNLTADNIVYTQKKDAAPTGSPTSAPSCPTADRGPDCCSAPNDCCVKAPAHEICLGELKCAYSAPATIIVDRGYGFFGTADFIYWQPYFSVPIGSIEKDGAFVSQGGTSLFPGVVIDFSSKTVHQKYKPGFKVGVGVDTCFDNWALAFEWTRFHCTQSGSLNLTSQFPETLFPGWLPAYQSGLADRGSVRWRLNYDTFDLNLSRPFYSGTRLTFEPFIGGRGGIINQRLNSSYNMMTHFTITPPIVPDDFSTTGSHIKGNTWILGPRAGMKGSWLFCHGFRMIGDTAAALLYTHRNSHFKQIGSFITDNPDQLVVKVRSSGSTFMPELDFNFGFGWGSYVSQKAYHLDFSASYNVTCYFNEDPISGLLFERSQNLVLHGLDIKARFDF